MVGAGCRKTFCPAKKNLTGQWFHKNLLLLSEAPSSILRRHIIKNNNTVPTIALISLRQVEMGRTLCFLYPSHSSNLTLLQEILPLSSSATSTSKHEIDYQRTESETSSTNLGLVLQSHGDGGVFWRELFPLLTSNNTDTNLGNPRECFVTVLFRHFRVYVTIIDQKKLNFLFSLSNSESESKTQNWSSKLYKMSDMLSQLLMRNMGFKRVYNLMLILLPPFPTPSPFLQPERIFTPLLIRQQNKFLKLQSLNAYISTLGGGYFLCRYLNTSMNLARKQRMIAMEIGDIKGLFGCYINEAYNWIYMGKFRKARKIIKKVSRSISQHNNDTSESDPKMSSYSHLLDKKEAKVLLSMCQSAELFISRVDAIMKEGILEQVSAHSTLDDDYHRIRISGVAH